MPTAERATTSIPLTLAQRSLLHTPAARGIGLDRLGRMATMRDFDIVASHERTKPVTVVQIGGGLDLHGGAMEEYWLQMCRGTAQDAVQEFGHLMRTDQALKSSKRNDLRSSEYFTDPELRGRITEQFANPNTTAYEMTVATLTDVLAQPVELHSGNKRQRHLAREIYTRFNTDQAYQHEIVTDIPPDEYGLGEERIIIPKILGGSSFQEMMKKILNLSSKSTEHVLQILATHFGAVLSSPSTIKPFQIYSLDARDPQLIAETAAQLYQEWFKETKRYKRALEFKHHVQQAHPWDLDGLAAEQVSHMVIKNTEPTHDEGEKFDRFKTEAPLVIARNGFVAIVPALIDYEGTPDPIANNHGYSELTTEWNDVQGFEMGVTSHLVADVEVAGVNSYERQLFREGPLGSMGPNEDRTGKPHRLYVVSFTKPRKSLAERAEEIRNRTAEADAV